MEYKTFFIIVATLALFLSVMLLVAPRLLVRTSEILNRDVDSSKYIMKNRLFFGGFITVLGFIMLYFLLWG